MIMLQADLRVYHLQIKVYLTNLAVSHSALDVTLQDCCTSLMTY